MTQSLLFGGTPCVSCERAPRDGRWLMCRSCLDAEARDNHYPDWAHLERATAGFYAEMDRQERAA